MIAERLANVRDAIARAAEAAGRESSTVKLIGVTKKQPAAAAREAVEAGLADLGENYAQELRDKARLVDGARWHFIGMLQRNKTKYVVGVAHLIHTVDSPSLAEEVARRAAAMGIVQRCLIQVNVGDEAQKAGCAIDQLPSLVDAIAALPSLALDGLMCIPPAVDAEAARPFFRKLAELARAERERTGRALAELSMGMSADFAVAVAEGATLLRVGTAIFGERPV